MHILEIDNKDQWNDFIKLNETGSFLQSWQWGEFQKAKGCKIWRFGVEDEGRIIACFLVIKQNLALGRKALFCPRGPAVRMSVLKNLNYLQQVFQSIMAKIDELAKQENFLYFRVDPQFVRHQKDVLEQKNTTTTIIYNHPLAQITNVLTACGLEKTNKEVHPRHTLIMEINRDPDQIMEQMHQKTRYNIRLAQKKGVTVEVSTDPADIDIFYRLNQETTSRNHFGTFPKEHFVKQMQTLGKEGLLKLYLAKFEDQYIAANLMIMGRKASIYLFGASSNQFRNVMAPYLLQWQAILDAHKIGCDLYDFWGIQGDNNSQKESSWQGITRFKKGFCPDCLILEYIGCFEKVYHPMALAMYQTAQKLKQKVK